METNNPLEQKIIVRKKCLLCNTSPMKGSPYCLHHNPEYLRKKNNLPSLKNLDTVTQLKNAYKGLIKGLYKGVIPENRAVKVGYLLNSYIKGMKDIFEMKEQLEKIAESEIPKIDYKAIEKVERLVKEMKDLKQTFSQEIPGQSGEIIERHDEINISPNETLNTNTDT